ncbi:MarR family transcriptional regulator [Cutibacterium equinum]|uniref:MarR family transcriptional regulator n=1 Tax=Cutibacterium equinum TaxID=3016342 RepID=A0ABY7QXR4_9ACTN|nr:MarR family transcriptional regulator [Cutibacterium equinum]WCC79786.1 MarR family transcriptional regulator [Cutibacterium equinum]
MSNPTPDLDHQLCFSLYRASRAVTRAYRPLLENIGLTYPQYLVMLVLWQADGPVGVNDIGARLHLDSGTLTPLLRRLEQAGFVTRTWSDNDGRRRLISLTSEGRSLRGKAAGVPEQVLALYPASPEKLVQVKAFLDDLSSQLE